MSTQIPSQFEQRNPEARVAPDSVDVATTSTSSGAGYGYGYGAGYATAGESELSLVHYLQILYRRRYVALTAFVAVVLIVAVNTFTAVRIYEGTVRILIERDNPNVVSFKEVLEQNSLTDDYYETQYEILRGRGLARRTIDALGLWSNPQPDETPRWTIRGILMAPVDTVLGWFEPPPPIQAPDAAETSAQSAVIDEFLGSLSVSAVRFSRLVDVTFSSPDPVMAAKAANALAFAYIQQAVDLRSSTTKEASAFLTQQLDEQRKKVEASEQALQGYRELTDSVAVEERQSIVVQKLEDLNAAVTRANTIRIQKEGAYNQAKAAQENPAAIDSLPLILSNTFVQQQKTELAQLQRQRAQLSEKLGPNHPDMVKVGIAITNAEAKILAEVARILEGTRSEYEAALSEERTLTTGLNRQKQEAQVLNRAGIQYGVLQRDATANRQMFEALLQRTQETGVSGQLKAGNIRVVDQAETPQGPVSPNVFNNLLMALLGGMALGVGLAFGFEYADDRIKNPDELKKQLGLPFLGMVPRLFDKAITTPLVSDGMSSAFSESFRSIRTNVLFSCAEEGGRLIVITSSMPGEGKTVVSSNLAITLAQTGQRVLLIDADMRKARVHEVFKLAVTPGLSNLLVGDAPASEAIRESSTPGLWVMPAGTSPPNPAELLGSKRFKDFTALLLQRFDWVIVDTPPVMPVTDATIAANLAHGVIFVVGAEMTSRRVARRAVEQLELGQAKFLGVVLNRVDLQHNAYYYSKYYRPDYGGYYGTPRTASGDGRAGATVGAVMGGAGAAGSKAARIAAAADEFNAASAASTTLTRAKAKTTRTSATSSVNPSTFGESVTFTATVSDPAGFGAPSGFVQFSDNGAVLGTPVPLSPVSGGGATFALLMTNGLTAGSHSIQAAYFGDDLFDASRADPLTQAVNKARPTFVVDDASVTYDGESHAGTGMATGVDGVDLGALTFTYMPGPGVPVNEGTYNVLGSYAGSANYEATASGATLTIEQARSTVVVDDATLTYDGPPHAATGGTLTGVNGVAFAFEDADDLIRNSDDLKKQLGLPFLGMVPRLFDETNAAPLVSNGVSSAFSESFRSIRTYVLFSSAGEEGGRVIVVTSSVANEGKTLVSMNLAITLAQAGRRVLLMDADMRNPRVHEVFSHPLTPGLSNLLVGDAVASSAIHASSTHGLWVMPAGTSPPNPAALLGSKRFKDFTAFLLQHFDWVIVDTPPVMTVTDASIAANLAHGVLFVVGADMTSLRVAQRAVEQLELGQAKFLGAVLNRVDLQDKF